MSNLALAQLPVPPAAASRAVSPPPLWKSVAPLRGLAIGLVVLSHASHDAEGMLLGGSPQHATLPILPVQLGAVVTLLALSFVCLFFFVFLSGFMLFRMYAGPGNCVRLARQILLKYVAWSLGIYLVLAVVHRHLDWKGIGFGLAHGGPLATYWYLPFIVVFYLLAPLLIAGIEGRPKAMLGGAIVVQLACFAQFYSGAASLGDGPGWRSLLPLNVVHFLPAFVGGMLAARWHDQVALFLQRHRRATRLAAALGAVACVGEAALIAYRAGFAPASMGGWYAAERASTVLFALLLLGLLMARDYGRGRSVKWLSSAGTSSLGIMLLTDMFSAAAIAAIWHVPALVSPAARLALAHHRLPELIVKLAPLFIVPLLIFNIAGPLITMGAVRRVLGRHARHLW